VSAILRIHRRYRQKREEQQAHEFLEELYAPARDSFLFRQAERDELHDAILRGLRTPGIGPEETDQLLKQLQAIAISAAADARGSTAVSNHHAIDAHNQRSPAPANQQIEASASITVVEAADILENKPNENHE
jgi:hypothetical protein